MVKWQLAHIYFHLYMSAAHQIFTEYSLICYTSSKYILNNFITLDLKETDLKH